MSDCPVAGCRRNVHFGYLLCRSHWQMVPAHLQRRVLDTWRAVINDGGRDAIIRWQEAADAAQHAVEAREATP